MAKIKSMPTVEYEPEKSPSKVISPAPAKEVEEVEEIAPAPHRPGNVVIVDEVVQV